MPQESRYSLQMDNHSSLVDYGYGAPSPKAAYRNSDIDFRDVFGGPPRRASIHDVRYSFTEGMESSVVSDRTIREASLRDPWTGAEEKPVFGGAETVNRRHLREDFFDDIFKGGESPSSTPRNVFSSSPGSRVLSPARPLPPRADGFGSPSTPSQLSLPDKLNKGMEFPTFGSTTAHDSFKDDTAPNSGSSPHSPKMSVFGFPTRVPEDSRNANHPSYRPSPLSQQFSLGDQELLEPTKSAEKSDDLKKDSEEVTQFHFSIYKWAAKGIPIPLVTTLRRTNSVKLKERRGTTKVSSFTEVPETSSPTPEPVPVTLQSLIYSGFSASDPDSVFYGMEGSESNSGSKDADASVHDVPRNGRGMKASEIKGMKLHQVLKEEVREELKSDSKMGSGDEIKGRRLDQVLNEEMREESKGNSKTEVKPLHLFFRDEHDEPGNAEYATDEKNRQRQQNKKVPKKEDEKKDQVFKKQDSTELPVPKKEDVKKVPPQKTAAPESTAKRRGKSKVKEFIRIFNQEPTPSKPKTTPNNPLSRSSRWKETAATVEAAATQQENNSQGSAVDERIIDMSYVEVPRKEADASDMIGSIHRPLHKEDPTNTAKHPPSHPSSDPTQRNTSSSRNVTITGDARETVDEADDSSQTSFTIKELSEDESKPTEDKEEIHATDAKIHQWSRGKEGNIRSLLSTLQYVLWPGSGWKPVPLVNIIEGPGVKRAYQKAMLCLHPDKLQQKGASSHQKYLAEKVFDILQEAWDHFNTLGGL